MPARLRILVTGSSGFIGGHLVTALRSRGDQVITLDRRGPADIVADIRDLPWLPTVDVLVHLAALAGVRPSFLHPDEYYAVNVLGTLRLLTLARGRVGRVVFASSSSIYGSNPAVPWCEAGSTQPLSPYASSKIAGEDLCRVYARDLPCTAVRYFTVYGPNQRPDLAIRTFADRLLKGEPVTVFGDGSSARDYTHVSDVVRATVAAIDRDEPGFMALNVGSGRPIALSQMVRDLAEALQVEPRIGSEPWPESDARITWADTRKARSVLGYEPQVSWEQGIAEFAQWMRAEQGRAA